MLRIKQMLFGAAGMDGDARAGSADWPAYPNRSFPAAQRKKSAASGSSGSSVFTFDIGVGLKRSMRSASTIPA
jgi:hypothetical protein